MTTTTFIWKHFFSRMITPSHPAVYQYIKGGHRSKETAIRRITEEVYEYCNPYWMGDDNFDIVFIRGIARQYLRIMLDEYIKGNIKVREIYRTDS